MVNPYAHDSNQATEPGKQLQLESSQVRVVQLITIALCAGVIIYLLFTLKRLEEFHCQISSKILLSVGAAVVAIIASLVVPKFVALATLNGQQGDTNTVGFQAFQIQHIIRLAILEAPAFFNIFVCGTTKSLIPAVAAGVVIASMLAQFPTAGRMQSWYRSITS